MKKEGKRQAVAMVYFSIKPYRLYVPSKCYWNKNWSENKHQSYVIISNTCARFNEESPIAAVVDNSRVQRAAETDDV